MSKKINKTQKKKRTVAKSPTAAELMEVINNIITDIDWTEIFVLLEMHGYKIIRISKG
jgi:hypothetical protein